MTFDKSDILNSKSTPRTHIQTANGDFVRVHGAGSVDVSSSIRLNNCLFIPNLSRKLLSISQLTKELDCTVLMSSSDCTVQDAQTGKVIGHGTERGGLYYVDETTHQSQALLTHGPSDRHLWMWHRRLGHPSLAYLQHLFPCYKNNVMSFKCETCVLAKSHKQSYSPSLTRSMSPFSLIHSDVWGPAPDFAIHHFSYYVLFVDDCTRMSWVYFLKHKSEVYSIFVTFYNMLKTQFHATPQILRSDNGGNLLILLSKNFSLSMA